MKDALHFQIDILGVGARGLHYVHWDIVYFAHCRLMERKQLFMKAHVHAPFRRAAPRLHARVRLGGLDSQIDYTRRFPQRLCWGDI